MRQQGAFSFDHGAQYATARDPGFVATMQAMAAAGDAAPWPAAGDGCWSGVGSMFAMVGHMERAGVGTVLNHRHVTYLRQDAEGWMVRHRDAADAPPGLVSDSGGECAGPFDRVAVALPSPQAAGLLQPHRFAAEAARAVMAPCWALMLAFPGASGAPVVLRPEAGPLGWIARDSSRPGRVAVPECWVAHATADWSRAHLEQPAPAVLAALHAAFVTATGVAAAPSHSAVHRWRYARTETPLGAAALWDAAAGLGVCGDWCLGARVEAAFLSGRALAGMMAG